MLKSRDISIFKALDWTTILIYLFLVMVGWLNIYAASYDFDQQTNIFDFSYRAGKQFVWILTAFGLSGIILLLDTRIYNYFGYIIYGLVFLLLLTTIFVAKDVKGSSSWLELGPLTFQPAELAKISTAIALAKFMSDVNFKSKNWKSFILPTLILFIPFTMIVLQKETGSALVFASFLLMFYREGMNGGILLIILLAIILFVVSIGFGTIPIQADRGSLGMVLAMSIIFLIQLLFGLFIKKDYAETLRLLFISIVVGFLSYSLLKVNYNYIAISFIIFSAFYWLYFAYFRRLRYYFPIFFITLGSVVFCLSADYLFNEVLKPHQQTRIHVFLGVKEDLHGAGYNVNQSKIAIGAGGLFGKGYLNGTQTKLKYVPEQDTDFIFCTVGEEWGFVGSTFIIFVYLALLLRIIHIAERQPDNFSRIYAYSVAGIFFFHLLINVGMVIGLMPVIGIPLPFLSYGGSSLWSFTIMLFILIRLDASRFRHRGLNN